MKFLRHPYHRFLLGVLLFGMFAVAMVPVRAQEISEQPMQEAQLEAIEVTRPVIEEAVVAHVQAVAGRRGLTAHGEKLNVDVLQVPGAPFRFKDSANLSDIALQTSSSLERFFSSRVLVRVKMESTSGRVKEIGVPVAISISKPVWVAKTTVMPGGILSPRDFELETREITTGFDRMVGEDVDITQYASRMMLRPGQMLSAVHMVRPPVVRRNAEVKVVMLGANGLKIVIPGKSMEDGQMGQRVRVRHLYKRDKFYTAKVIGENRVQLHM